MAKKINLTVDLMGAESDYVEAIRACEKFLAEHDDLQLCLVATAEVLDQVTNPQFQKIVAQSEIKQDDSIMAARRKTDSSMYLGLQALANQQTHGLLSAGNTNAFVTLTYAIVGLKPNINKPAFMPFVPTSTKNKTFNILDVGANLEVNAQELVQFATMADEFNKKVLQIPHPRVGILNIGTEKHKGFSYHQEAAELLKNDPKINYIGFIEPKTILENVCDIVVCDGYAGNLVLKAMEGTSMTLAKVIKQYFQKSIWTKLSYLFVRGMVQNLRTTFDYKNNAGAIILGVNGLVVKTHGSAGFLEYYSSLRLLYQMAKSDY
ncbi:glycerol-3-phosphate acyltransferase PlsX [Mycoplasmoides fastidiosum]|uniref:Phosphate acyltransferase n=1 Tax=Mycoplasmoides fastidiosum TaxID=92758 RepID=A0ABU0LZD2_9BACT|nr:phosphate acyltransferase PlsX [Mycoplasmoides fastidiosum]MDQ0514054.1 glycerol-3-phosphate acyltransferase PlsX [Mycoplasmoides fastidiosum]UUD37535.1 phosphate acyltransferase PlsX [Mycoplasmoides fastidiosum]